MSSCPVCGGGYVYGPGGKDHSACHDQQRVASEQATAIREAAYSLWQQALCNAPDVPPTWGDLIPLFKALGTVPN